MTMKHSWPLPLLAAATLAACGDAGSTATTTGRALCEGRALTLTFDHALGEGPPAGAPIRLRREPDAWIDLASTARVEVDGARPDETALTCAVFFPDRVFTAAPRFHPATLAAPDPDPDPAAPDPDPDPARDEAAAPDPDPDPA